MCHQPDLTSRKCASCQRPSSTSGMVCFCFPTLADIGQ